MRRLSVPVLCAVLLGLTPGAGSASLQATPPDRPGLEGLWAPGPVLHDRNGDGFVDAVDAGVQVASARPAATAAALDLAARLGFETQSISLPLPATARGVTFVVDGTPDAPLALLLDGDLPHPGRGFALLDGDLGDGAHVRLWGHDDEGLRAAVLAIAGRLPRVWADDGLTLAEALDTLRSTLQAAGLPQAAVRARGLVVRADRAGIERLLVEVGGGAPAAIDGLAERVDELRGAVPEQIGELRLHFPDAERAIDVAGAELPSATAPRPTGGGREELSLAMLWEIGGMLGDADGDRVPDRTDVLVSSAVAPLPPLLDLGARLGVEAAGIDLPFALPHAALDEPESTALPLLIGADHPLLEELVGAGKLGAGPGVGQARIELVPAAWEKRAAIAVRGAGAALEGAVGWLARTAPHFAERGPDRPTLAELEEEVWRLLTLRSPAGQAAGAFDALERLLRDIPAEAEGLEIDIAVEHAAPELAALLRERLAPPGASLAVENLDVGAARPLLDERYDIDGEVAALWGELDPHWDSIPEGAAVTIEARLSEPRAVRDRLATELADRVREAGGLASEIRILPAYKQGLGWLEEVIAPRLAGTDVAELVICFAPYEPPEDWPGQAMGTRTRWLLELFPVDELLAADLGLPLDAIRFEQGVPGDPTYRVRAYAGDRSIVLDETFEPTLVVRPYFDLFPRYERVRVTTGAVRLEVEGRPRHEARVATDLERVWDLYQTRVLPRLHDYVLRLHEGRPRPDLAPHFGELRIEAELSEPERPLGIDQERIAPMEWLHEELYFGTLHFMDLVGRIANGSPLSYPGRVIPVVRPLAHGRGGSVRFRLTGFDAPGPRVQVRYRHGGREHRLRRDLLPVDARRPLITAVETRAGEEGLAAVEIYQPVDSHEDRRAELVARTSARRVDGSWLDGERVQARIRAVEELRAAGLYRRALAYPGLGELRLLTAPGHAIAPREARVVSLPPNGAPTPPPDPRDLLAAAPVRALPSDPLVQWRRPIPPDEAHAIVATLAAEFDEATAVRVGRSYLGKEIWALELIAPLSGSHFSRAKAAELKPTVVYSARQHANEVSSTSHVLRLAEQLASTAEGRAILDRINVVVHPITNPDGAQLAYDLWQLTPDHMLHAGYLGALGVDATAGAGDDDPIYPESRVRERLWETWRPDIFLNPHGYPSHEWVQPFSEYAAWVRHRTTQSRDWWGMRGWFMPGFGWLDDPEYPRHAEEAFRLRGYITRAINGVDEIAALNRRAYDRYRRYGPAFDDEAFKLDFTDGVLIYTAIKGDRAGGSGWVERNPKVTVWSGSTEAPDETAHGDWLELVASAGLAWDRAILDYLLASEHPVERSQEATARGLRLTLHRERPGRPPAAEEP